jgi:hypothetical protein
MCRSLESTWLQATHSCLRTWKNVLDFIIDKKKEGACKHRWETARKDKALKSFWKLKVVETRVDQMLMLLKKVSANVYLRRLHNYALDMNWLAWSIVPKHRWPKVVYKQRKLPRKNTSRLLRERPIRSAVIFMNYCGSWVDHSLTLLS